MNRRRKLFHRPPPTTAPPLHPITEDNRMKKLQSLTLSESEAKRVTIQTSRLTEKEFDKILKKVYNEKKAGIDKQ